jgi:hypothetical protein|tara:strand:- start:948 stop:1145 length:198 start_codon:yes stop_codon:yes gene_type:complete
MYWGTGVAESNTQCDNCRIEISTDGIEVDASTGNIALEAGIVVGILILVSVMYIGKKWIDKKFKD